jgi:hypothetical protein
MEHEHGAAIVTMPMGTLIRKIARQPKAVVRTPPRS